MYRWSYKGVHNLDVHEVQVPAGKVGGRIWLWDVEAHIPVTHETLPAGVEHLSWHGTFPLNQLWKSGTVMLLGVEGQAGSPTHLMSASEHLTHRSQHWGS
jgi:hypothetical protein